MITELTFPGREPGNKEKITDEVILSLYTELKNFDLVGKKIGMTRSGVHLRLKKMNYTPLNITRFTEIQKDIVRSAYQHGFDTNDGTVERLCAETGHTRQFISRFAKSEGLSNSRRSGAKWKLPPKPPKEKNPYVHPRGMLNKTHSEEVKAEMSIRTKRLWKDPNFVFNSEEFRQRISDNSSKNMERTSRESPESIYSRGKSGFVNIADKRFYARSSWEANIAAYLQFLKENNEIVEWEYEPTTFWFLKIKRGVRSYKPDFLITRKDGSKYFIEVKGYMDDKSKTKLSRMKIYYPEVEIEVLDKKRYVAISKSAQLFKWWGQL